MNNRIDSIHYLRGLAAILVVMFHFRGILDGVYAQKDLGSILFASGAFGVDLFFMISGFIIALSTKNSPNSAIFVTRRFFRIYPAFITVFIIGALTTYSDNSTNDLIRSMFFIHKDYAQPSPGFGYNILGPAWTLSYEIYFYFLFVISMSLSHKYRTLISSLLLISPMVLIQLVFSGSLSLSGTASADIGHDNPFYEVLRFSSSPILVEFAIGMAVYEIYSRIKMINKKLGRSALYLCSSIFLVFYLGRVGNGFGMQSFGLWSIILITGVMLYEKSNEIKTSRCLSFLGDISYSLYISHYLIMNMLNDYKPLFWYQYSGISKFLLSIIICICVSYVLFVCIEKPFIAFGKKIELLIKSRINKECLE